MPTYDYKCPKCQKISEKFHKPFETFNYSCEKCAENLMRFYTPCLGLHFKGSGFYETDYKNK